MRHETSKVLRKGDSVDGSRGSVAARGRSDGLVVERLATNLRHLCIDEWAWNDLRAKLGESDSWGEQEGEETVNYCLRKRGNHFENGLVLGFVWIGSLSPFAFA